MIQQMKFNSQNAEQLTLSPYVQIFGLGTTRLLITRNDLGKRFLVETKKEEFLIIVFEHLKNGITELALTDLLHSYGIVNTSKWIQMCLENGVIE